MSLFDIFDDFFIPETEEIRKKREELANEPSFLSLGGSPEDFKSQIQRIQKQYPGCRVESEDVEFDNGYFRRVNIKCEEESNA